MLLILLLLLLPFLWWYSLLKKYKTLSKVPGPRPLPLIGNTLDLGGTPQALLKNCFEFCKKYGFVYKLHVGNEVKIMISEAELLESLLNSNVHITKSTTYDLMKPWLGIGLLISTGRKWKIRRKMITPTFHFKILEEFMDIFNSAGNILVEKLSKEVWKEAVDVFPFINLYSLDVICETAMGIKIGVQEDKNSDYVDAVRGYLDIFIRRTFSAWQRFDLLFRFTPTYATYRRSLETLHRFSRSVISRRRRERSAGGAGQRSAGDDGIRRKVALLDMLLESESNELLTDEDIREEIDTFMFEGHDTTTSGIAFTVLALADHPDVQARVHEEIQSVIGGEASVSMQHLQSMRYLDMVVKEVQRFYPSVPMVERKLEADWSLGGYSFPKDTTLTVFTYGLHYNEKYFPNPEVFDPNRFLPEVQAQRHNYAYVPFSAGPRNCIGQKFAMLEMKTTLVKIVRRFRILQVPNFKPDLGMAAILKSYNGVQVRLQLRN